jgi:hypothetical protein
VTSSAYGATGRRALALAAAAAVALSAALGSVPASAAEESPTPAVTGGAASPSVASRPSVSSPSVSKPSVGATGVSASGISDEGLAEAVARDLGMTLAEFNAAGAQGKRAADALATLRKLPGFVALSLHDGHVLVEGTGPGLGRGVDALNAAGQAGRNEFVLIASGAASAARVPGTPVQTTPAHATPAPATPAGATPAPETPAKAAPARATPAQGPAPEKDLQATSTEQLYRAYLHDVGAAGLQAVAAAGGKFIIRTGGVNSPEKASQSGQQPGGGVMRGAAGETGMSPSEFVAQYANVVLEKGEPMASEEDFLGGQGYRIDGVVVCSSGFSAFSPGGEPLVLTAGHCAEDGTARLAEVTLPAGEPAGGSVAESGVTGELGTFGFSQFGGPGNARISTDPAGAVEPGSDIAVIESIRSDLDLLPAATTWDDPADLGAGAVPIVGTAAPFVGQAVCRSGRTAGWSCGTVDEVGIYVVEGGSGEPDDLRSFRGFLSTSVQSSGGDSGGPWISGNYAVGTHSAGNSRTSAENFAVAATLQESLNVLPGVQLRLFLNKPALDAPLPAGPIAAGQRITGRIPAAPAAAVPAGSSVRIVLPAHEPLDVPADADGNWSFTAPASATQFSAQTINGFSRSGTSTFSTVEKPAASNPATPSKPAAPARSVRAAELKPAPQPSVVAVLPDGITYIRDATASTTDRLADTGASGLLAAGGVAGAALLLGGLLLLAVRRRGRR